MRRTWTLLLITMLALALAGTAQASPGGRACGGRTVGDDEACCISGTVTLGGKPVAGALVSVQLAGAKRAADDVTSTVESDPAPTYGFALHDAPLAARPGDKLLITVSYGVWQRQIEHAVEPGQQWLDIALDAP